MTREAKVDPPDNKGSELDIRLNRVDKSHNIIMT